MEQQATPLTPQRGRRIGRLGWRGRGALIGATSLVVLVAGCGPDSPSISTQPTRPAVGATSTSTSAPGGSSSTSSSSAGGSSTSSTGSSTSAGAGDGGQRITTTSQGSSGAAPAQPGEGFVPGDFAKLPLPSGSQPVGDPHVSGNTTIRSWKVTGMTPQQVLGFYAQELPPAGWTVAQGPGLSGAVDWAGEWARADEVLRVTASQFNGGQDAQYITQLNLQLTTG